MAASPVMPKDFYVGRWDQANIPIKFRGLRLNDYEPSHRTGEVAVDAAKKFINEFENHYISSKRAGNGEYPSDRSQIGKGMLFFGRNGTRKSTLATAILTEVQYISPSYKIFYVRFSAWKKALTATFDREDSERTVLAKKLLTLAEQAHLLVLDDIGQEHRTTSGFTESELHEFLRVRYEAAKPTIVTTNIEPDLISNVYNDSFGSFQHDAFDLYPILGKDTRLSKE